MERNIKYHLKLTDTNDRKESRTANKKYMIIAVSVLITEFTARNNFGAARQESAPQSATTYISER
jgi:hypothetical protein